MTKSISPPIDRPILPHAQVISVSADDATVLLDLRGGQYYSLNAVAARVWTLLGDGKSISEVAATLQDEFSVDRVTAEQDARELVVQLLESRLVVCQ